MPHFAGEVKVISKITEECKMPEIIKNDGFFRTLQEKSICRIPYFLNIIIWKVLPLWQLQLNYSVLAQNAFSTSIYFFSFLVSFSISFKWDKSKWTLKISNVHSIAQLFVYILFNSVNDQLSVKAALNMFLRHSQRLIKTEVLMLKLKA